MSAVTGTAHPPTLAERAVASITRRLARAPLSRRRLLTRATVVAAALAVDPVRYVLRPGSAMATVCGSGSSCTGGWTAFCCTINDGANTCPDGTFAAGWWKVDQSAYCNGAPRYYIDCNRLPQATCSCTCADGDCDRRKVCCNRFRYGQCHNEVPGITEVVCRVITCITPWEWDPGCSATVRTDNRTASHSASCLPGPNPSPIAVRYQDIGMTGSIVGRSTQPERASVGGGHRADYTDGVLTWTATSGVAVVHGRWADAWLDAGGEAGPLGWPRTDVVAVGDGAGLQVDCDGGLVIGRTTGAAHALWGPVAAGWVAAGGVGELGYPVSNIESVGSAWERTRTDGGWQVVHNLVDGDTRVLPVEVELPADGTWPAGVEVVRRWGPTRYDTAADVATAHWGDGAATVVLASGRSFPDGLTGGVAAALAGGPLLLTDPAAVPEVLRVVLERLRVTRLLLLGGDAAVGPAVRDALSSDGRDVVRLDGSDRYATAVQVSRHTFPDGAATVHLATGTTFADALAAVPAAARGPGPVLLTAPGALPDVVAAELRRLSPGLVTVMGGERAVAEAVVAQVRALGLTVVRRSGVDRYATAAAIADGFDPADTEVVVVASGEDFPDGLTAGALAARLGVPVLLVQRDAVPDVTWDALTRLRPRRVELVGGPSVVTDRVVLRLASAPWARDPQPEPTPEPSPTPSESPAPSPTPSESPTASPTPTESPTPTTTPTSPSPTPTSTSTATPTPTETDTSSPTPTETDTSS